MPPLPPAPAVADQAALFEQAQQLLAVAPRLAFEKASLLREPILRERMRRDAYLSLTRTNPKEAATLLPGVIGARWLPSIHFAQALDVAWHTVATQPALSKQLLMATASRHPAAALRELAQYIELPYGPAIRDAARRAAAVPPADLLLLQLKQNPTQTVTPAETLRLAASATTEDERATALRLLRRHTWDAAADPYTLRGSLALLAESGEPLPVPAAVIHRSLTGIDEAEDPLAEAVKAAVILAAAPPTADEALPATPLGRVLRSLRPTPSATLHIPDLFPDGLCVQRYVFHDDDDGVESFNSFLAAYANDPHWTLQRTPERVILSSRGNQSRRIEIYANVPSSKAAIPAPRPTVLVHRGHDHHFDATRKFLTHDARLVFLGSCRGMANVEDVVTRCRRAQVIATRGIGTTAVNDAFLRALNNRLLEPGDTLDWNQFWASLQPALGASQHFRDYVQPHRNPAARFLAAWYREALSAP